MLAGLIAAVGFYVGWWHFVRERRVEKLRWEQQWGREDEDQPPMAVVDLDWLEPWWSYSQAMEEEGLVPPPV